MQKPIRLHSKYVHSINSDRGHAYVEAAFRWLAINQSYVNRNIKPENEELLLPIKQELDNLQQLFKDIVRHHESKKWLHQEPESPHQ